MLLPYGDQLQTQRLNGGPQGCKREEIDMFMHLDNQRRKDMAQVRPGKNTQKVYSD